MVDRAEKVMGAIDGTGVKIPRPSTGFVLNQLERSGAASERYDAAKASKGIWRDEVFKKGPDGQPVLVEDSAWKNNLIVVGMTKLLAGLMANEPSFGGGILFSAQGRGDPSFDISLPVPLFNSVKLVDEYFRKTPDSISFLDDDGNGVVTVTNRILIVTTLDFPEANGPSGDGEFIREQGLYGGTALAGINSGLLANLIYHKARFKDDTVKLRRSIQFIF